MGSYYHQKFHRHNHHTNPTLSSIYPDTALDPIASYEHPFNGDFVTSSDVFAKELDLTSDNITLHLSSDNLSVSAHGDAIFERVFQAKDLDMTNTIISVPPQLKSLEKQCFVRFNDDDYSLRVWDNTSIQSDIAFQAPSLVDKIEEDFFNGGGDYEGSFLNFIITGTRPISFTWYRGNSKQIVPLSKNVSYLFVDEPSAYTLVATNRFGSLTCESVNIPFDEDVLVNHKDASIVTHDGFELLIDYTYIDVFNIDDDIDETSLLVSDNKLNYKENNYILV